MHLNFAALCACFACSPARLRLRSHSLVLRPVLIRWPGRPRWNRAHLGRRVPSDLPYFRAGTRVEFSSIFLMGAMRVLVLSVQLQQLNLVVAVIGGKRRNGKERGKQFAGAPQDSR